MKDIIGTLIIMLLCITALAQQSSSKEASAMPKPDTKQEPDAKPIKSGESKKKHLSNYTNESKFVSPVSVQVLAGSQGVGADFKYGFLPGLSGRMGFGVAPVDVSRGLRFTGFPADGQLSARFSNIHLLADYSPFKSNNFRVVGGAAYLIQGNADVVISPSGGYTIGSQSLTESQIGELHAGVTWKGIAPYLGLGFFRSFPGRLFNINLDLGSYYLSSPGTSFTGTQLLSDNSANAKQFNENMHGYRWLPVVQLNFNFRIK
jgi:hypothetical protein